MRTLLVDNYKDLPWELEKEFCFSDSVQLDSNKWTIIETNKLKRLHEQISQEDQL